MKKTSIEREKKRQQAVAREYRKKGYEVILEPGPSALPLFLAGFRPDLLARNENETVVIEIKSQETLSKSRAMVGQARRRRA